MSTFASRFKGGIDIGNSLVNTYQTANRNREMAGIASATESAAYTPEQGQDLEALANAKDANGNPYYTVSNDASGKYTVTPNFQNETGAEPAPYTPTTMAAKGVSFLGKNYDAPLTEAQSTGARQQAMAGVMEKNGDTEGAMRYRQQSRQGELTDMQIDQAKRQGAREDSADAYEKSRQEVFNGSVFGQQNVAYAKQVQDYVGAQKQYEEGIAAGRSPQELGPVPQKPSRAAYSLADSLADQGALLANDAKHGKVDAKTFGAFSENMRKIEDEGYLKALNLAQGGASLDEIAKAFNASGQMKFDSKAVLDDKTTPGQGGVPERVITIKDENGNTQTINVMAQLKSLGKAGDALNQFYAGETNRRGNSGEVRAEKSLGIQQAQLGLSQASHAAATGARKDAKGDKEATVAAGMAKFKQDNPDATAVDLEAVKRGILSAVPKADTNGYKIEMGEIAQALGTPAVDAQGKPAVDFITGRQTVNRNTEEEKKFFQWMRENGITDSNKGLALYRQGGGTAAPVASFTNGAEAEAAQKAGKIKSGDRVMIGGRAATTK